MAVGPGHYLALSAILFTIGVVGVLTRKNAIIVFMAIEIMLNAANLAFVSAVAAGAIAADAADDPEAFTTGFEAERAWQRGWLLARLGVEPRRQGESPTARRAPNDQETMSSSSSR